MFVCRKNEATINYLLHCNLPQICVCVLPDDTALQKGLFFARQSRFFASGLIEMNEEDLFF